MEDFPLWLKVVIYVIVGATAIYMVVGIVYALRNFG
jgi:hypothetical protein